MEVSARGRSLRSRVGNRGGGSVATCLRRTLSGYVGSVNLIATVGLVVCWAAVVLVWLAGAVYYESRAPAERTRARFVSPIWATVVIFALVSVAMPRGDWKDLTLHTAWVRILGLVILLAATAFTLWARLVLGAMWSAAPTVKEGHQLHTSGPYGITRHPIYTGLLGMILGSLLLSGGGRWIVALPVYVVLLEFKIHTEERLMLAQFPDDYPRYRQRVPQLIPGLRLPTRRRATAH